jgi:hypothetical protein
MKNQFVTLAEKAIVLWTRFIETRESAYKRKMDKRVRKAVDFGEKLAFAVKDYISMVKGVGDARDLERMEHKIERIITKFFKYNQ